MSLLHGADTSNRPRNDLLTHLSDGDYALIAPHLSVDRQAPNETLYNPGDNVETVYFPCDTSAACFVLSVQDGREVQVLMIGREGAVGGIVSHGRLPAFSRSIVRFGGRFARLPVARLEAAKVKSPTLADLFARYADCLLAQTLQGSACNAAHSIEQRAAKWILVTMERTERDVVPLGHEQLATMLGIGRSYASRVILALRAQGILETGRMEFRVLDETLLRSKSCNCDEAVRAHFKDVLSEVYPAAEITPRT
jgi:CRP-like cAMP-binding protein